MQAPARPEKRNFMLVYCSTNLQEKRLESGKKTKRWINTRLPHKGSSRQEQGAPAADGQNQARARPTNARGIAYNAIPTAIQPTSLFSTATRSASAPNSSGPHSPAMVSMTENAALQ